MMKSIKSFLSFVAAVGFFVGPAPESSLAAPEKVKPEKIRVGVALRFAAELNSSVDSLYKGIEFAAQNFNRSQKNIEINLVKYSHRTDLKSVDAAAEKIKKEKIQYVIGGEMSDEAMTLGQAFKNENILFITPTASNPRVTDQLPLVYRVNFSDNQVASKLATYVHQKVLKSSEVPVGILHNTGNSYTDYLSVESKKRLQGLNPKIKIIEFNYAGTHPQFTSAVKEFKSKNVAMVVAFTLLNDLEAFYELAASPAFQFYPQYLGSDGWNANESVFETLVKKQTVKSFQGIRSSYWRQESRTTSVLRFTEDYRKAYGKNPDASAAIAYDSAIILFRGLAQAKLDRDPKAIAKILSAETFRDLVTTRVLKFNEHHSPERELNLYKISAEGIRFLEVL